MAKKNAKSERIIMVKPEPFVIRLDPEADDAAIQDLLDDEGIGDCGYKDITLKQAIDSGLHIRDSRNDPGD